MKIEPQQLKEFLLDAGIASEKKIEACFKEAEKTGEKPDDILVSKKIISQKDLIKLKAYILGIPFVNLKKTTISEDVLKIIPEPIAREHNIVSFRKTGNNLEVAMLDPEDLQTIEFIKKKSGLKIFPCLTNQESIKFILRQYQKSLETEFGEIIKGSADRLTKTKTKTKKESEGDKDLKKMAEDLPIIKIVDTLLKHAILEKASDIHIEPQEKDIIVRYRIDGLLRDAMNLPKKVLPGIIARIKVLSNLRLDEHRLSQDGRFKIETEDYKISFRVSVLPVFDGEKIVMRLLDESSKGLTLEALGLDGKALEIIQENIRKPNGMVLVTGPTGSGKTSTLYSIMDILNVPEVNINTIEDPIEYRMPRINQTQVKPKIGLTFASGLRTLLRQDPDIIMVGEIRDEETATLAIHAALTGHLVLSTLHTNNAAGTLPRLLDMGVESYLVASTVKVIIAQRLVRQICPDCREKYKLSQKEIKDLSKTFDLEEILDVFKSQKVIDPKIKNWSELDFFRGKGCEHCRQKGYKGRIGIFEVLEITDNITSMISRESTSDIINQEAAKEGMSTILQNGFIKAARGITTIEEVLRVTRE
jgi:type IV pilus assembly protein PilB